MRAVRARLFLPLPRTRLDRLISLSLPADDLLIRFEFRLGFGVALDDFAASPNLVTFLSSLQRSCAVRLSTSPASRPRPTGPSKRSATGGLNFCLCH
jgi:hypothetical protein